MSEGDLRAPNCFEENGLRETFLVGLPADMRDHLRIVTLGLYRLAGRYGLLYQDEQLGRKEADRVGLYRDLDFLKQLSGHYERQAEGPTRERVRDIRILLEEAVAQARYVLPEGSS